GMGHNVGMIREMDKETDGQQARYNLEERLCHAPEDAQQRRVRPLGLAGGMGGNRRSRRHFMSYPSTGKRDVFSRSMLVRRRQRGEAAHWPAPTNVIEPRSVRVYPARGKSGP